MNPVQTSLAITLFIVVTAPALQSCDSADRTTVAEHLQTAQDFESRGELRSSAIELKNAVQKDPNNAQARLLLGNLYIKLGDGLGALKELEAAQSKGVAPEAIKVPMGSALLLNGSYDRVLKEILPGAQTSQTNHAKILQLRGDALRGKGKLNDGCKLYEESLGLDSRHLPSYWGLAHCAAARGELENARKILVDAQRLDERNPHTWILLGALSGAQKDRAGEESAYRKAIQFDPQNIEARLSLATLLLQAGKIAEAEKEIAASRKIAPENLSVSYLQGMSLYGQNKLREAQATLQDMRKSMPDHLPSTFLLGAIAHDLGQYEEGESLLRRYLATYPEHLVANRTLASILIRTNRFEDAGTLLRSLLKSHPNDAQLYSLAGEVALRSGDTQSATTYLQKAASLAPGVAEYQLRLGVTRFMAGNPDAALADVAAAHMNTERGGVVDSTLTLMYLSKKDYSRALQEASKLVQTKPDLILPRLIKADVHLAMKDSAAARVELHELNKRHPDDFNAVSRLAALDLSEKKPEQARQRYLQLLERDKQNGRAMSGLAGIAMIQGNETDYLKWMNAAAKANPKNVEFRKQIVSYYIGKKDSSQALRLARETLQNNPESGMALDLLAQAYALAGDRENTLATLRKLGERSPRSHVAQFKLGAAELESGNMDRAMQALNKSLALKPGFVEAGVALAGIHMKTGKTQQALETARRIQRQNPNRPTGYILEGDILAGNKQWGTAVAAYQKAIRASDNGAAAVKLHNAQARTGAIKVADNQLLQWLKLHPEDLSTRLYLAESYLGRNDSKAAQAQYEVILKQQPANLLALNNLANLIAVEDPRRARALAEQAYQRQPGNPALQDTLGWLLAEGGDLARGIPLLQSAVKGAPDLPQARYRLALALSRNGDKAAARKELDRLLSSGKPFPQLEEARRLRSQL
jgi:putative PEP-CTERM system TPR-repeat lipoprotein